MSTLFSPLKLKSILIKNRIGISPMCQYSSQDGFPSDWHFVHLGSRAVGGAGLIIQEATAVSPEGRISAMDAGIYLDAHVEKWKAITSFLLRHGTVPAIQLAHAGRKASCAAPWGGGKQVKLEDGGWHTVAPSSLAFNTGELPPISLDREGIQKVLADFKAAARRSREAGYAIIEIHAAHGYLIHEFLSPLSNHRTDQYGGSFENRIRLLLEIIEAVQLEWPEDLPLFVRISVTDWAEGGWNEEESLLLTSILKKKGVDLIDCSSAGLLPYVKIPLGPGYQVPFAERIKRETGILTAAVGLITQADQAESILNNKQADLILLARESLRNPYFPLQAARVLGADHEWPNQYLRAK